VCIAKVRGPCVPRNVLYGYCWPAATFIVIFVPLSRSMFLFDASSDPELLASAELESVTPGRFAMGT